MKNFLFLGLLALPLTTASGQVRECKNDVSQAEAVLEKLKHMIEIGDASQMDIYSIPYHWLTPVAVYPELIEVPHRLHPKNPEFTDEFLRDFVKVIAETNVGEGKKIQI